MIFKASTGGSRIVVSASRLIDSVRPDGASWAISSVFCDIFSSDF